MSSTKKTLARAALASLFAVITAAGANCALPAYRVDPTLEEAGIPSAVGPCGALPYGEESCRECTEAECCAEAATCGADVTCAPFATCIGACTAEDAACRLACFDSLRVEIAFRDDVIGVSANELALNACQRLKCTDRCSSAKVYQAHPLDCEPCLARACPAQVAACSGSEACGQTDRCFERCLNPWCRPLCETAKKNEPYALLLDCATNRCSSECFRHSWGCVDNHAWPYPTTATAKVDFLINNAVVNGPMADVTVNACTKLDLRCEKPVATGTSGVDGTLSMTIPMNRSFDGYFEAHGGDLYPMLWYGNRPIWADTFHKPVCVDTSAVGFIASSVDIKADPNFGLLGVESVDCEDNEAPGMRFDIGMDLPVFYAKDGLVVRSETATTNDGAAFFVNVPEGLVTIRAIRVDKQQEVARLDVYVRKGTMTYAILSPRVVAK